MAFRAGVTIADAGDDAVPPDHAVRGRRDAVAHLRGGPRRGGSSARPHGRRFMKDYHRRPSLPRGRGQPGHPRADGQDQLPRTSSSTCGTSAGRRSPSDSQIDRQCRSFGIDPGKDLIPVHPAAHYMIGGARADLDGRTNLAGLWPAARPPAPACTGPIAWPPTASPSPGLRPAVRATGGEALAGGNGPPDRPRHRLGQRPFRPDGTGPGRHPQLAPGDVGATSASSAAASGWPRRWRSSASGAATCWTRSSSTRSAGRSRTC